MNPELRRNLWLQFSLTRLLLAPVAIGALLTLTWVVSDRSLAAVAEVARAIYYLLVVLWGTRRAADLVAEEIAGGTWDDQRMSALGAWQMSWGKLFGGTSYVWYAAGLAFLALVGCYWAAGTPPWQSGEAIQLLRLLGTGALAQAVAMLVSLALLRRLAIRRRLGVSLSQVAGILAGVMASGQLDGGIVALFLPEVAWYGRVWDGELFSLATLGCVPGLERLRHLPADARRAQIPERPLGLARLRLVPDGLLRRLPLRLDPARGRRSRCLADPALPAGLPRSPISPFFSSPRMSFAIAGWAPIWRRASSDTPGSCCRNGCRSIS